MSVNCLFNDLRPDLTGLHVSVPKALLGKTLDESTPNLKTLVELLQAAQIPWIAAFDDLKDDEFYLAVVNAP